MQYWFNSGYEHKVTINLHGNNKKKQPYCRTNPSTMMMIKHESKSAGPKDTVCRMYNKQGGMIEAKSLGELPRNHAQVANMRRSSDMIPSLCSKKTFKDPLFMVMEQCKSQDGKDKFVRTVTTCPEPMCLLSTDQQLDYLARFCTDPNEFCVLSADPTFSLGDFSVTCITYRNLLVTETHTSQSPIMVGAMLVHQSKSFEVYNFFVSTLIGITPSLARILAFGTDGELALVKAFKQQFCFAFKQQFCFAVHLRCFRHMSQDIQRKANDMGFPADATTELLSHVSGTKSGPTFFEGMIDCNSESEFEAKLLLVEAKWRHYEQSRSMRGGQLAFFDWFKRYHAEEIKCSMLCSVRQATGLGDPPSQYYTNDSKSINSAVKQHLQFKKSDWSGFNEKMKKFVMNQQEEICKAILGTGQYVLKEKYMHLAISPH